MLVRLLYVSRAESPISAANADEIVARAKHYNPDHGITGVLCYTGDIYMQVLEGGRGEVNDLYGQIIRDDRHADVTLLDYAEIDERRFVGWTMGRVNLDKVNPALLLKYSARKGFDPYAASGKNCLALLNELLSSAAVISRQS
ncbi:MAG: BLUF domain-containing protein [Burkholderiaceae bacterium]